MRYACVGLLSAAAIGLGAFGTPAFAEPEQPIGCARSGGAHSAGPTYKRAPVIGPQLKMRVAPAAIALAPGTAVADPPLADKDCLRGLHRYNSVSCR